MATPLRVLVIDDSAEDTELLLRHLRQEDFAVESARVETADGLRAALAEGPWAIALSDYVMPQLDGREAIAILRAEAPELPVIVVSGNVGEEYAVAVMRAGASDYVRKDNLARLAGAVRREVAATAERRARVLAEQELALQAVIIRNMIEGVCLIQVAEERILYANPTYERMFGYPPGELVGRSPSALAADTDTSRAADTHARIVAGLRRDGSWAGEVHNRRQDGSTFWTHASVMALEHAEHGPVWVVVQQDITEQKTVRDELTRTNRFLQALVDNIPSVVFVKDARTSAALLWNRMAERMLGYPQSALLGRPPEEFWPAAEAATFARDDRAALTSESPITVKEWVSGADGMTRLFETTKFAIRDDTGEPLYLLGIAHDITRRALQEAELSEKLALLDLAHDAIFVADLDQRITFWNRGAEQTYGWSAEEAMGRVASELLATTFPEPFETVRATFRARKSWAGELINRRRDGSAVVVASRWSVRTDASGEPVAVLAIDRDITREKLALDARARSEKLLRAVFEQAETGLAVVDMATGRILEANPSYCRMAGLAPDQIGTATWGMFAHPDDVPDQLREMRRLGAGEIARCVFENRFLRPDGTITRGTMTVVPLWQSGEAPTEHLILVREAPAGPAAAPLESH